jgi:hypothetical protein
MLAGQYEDVMGPVANVETSFEGSRGGFTLWMQELVACKEI